jgi:hypothetical protein
MAKKSGGLRDYTRVCNKCGTSRLLPEAAAKDKGPNQRQVGGMQRATKYARRAVYRRSNTVTGSFLRALGLQGTRRKR